MLASTIRQSSPQAACRPSKARELKAILRLGCRSRQSCRCVRHQHGRHRTSRGGHWPIAAVRRHGGCEGRKPMLRITDTLHVTPAGRATWTLALEGTAKDEWVRELRRAWRRIREAEPGVPIRVELADVRFVDPAGKVLLAEMYRDGVE